MTTRMAKARLVETEEELRELDFSGLVHSFAATATDLSCCFAFSCADDLLKFLADPARRRTLRRRAYACGHIIDAPERAAVGFAKIQPIFALLAATAAEDGVDHDTRFSDFQNHEAVRIKRSHPKAR